MTRDELANKLYECVSVLQQNQLININNELARTILHENNFSSSLFIIKTNKKSEVRKATDGNYEIIINENNISKNNIKRLLDIVTKLESTRCRKFYTLY